MVNVVTMLMTMKANVVMTIDDCYGEFVDDDDDDDSYSESGDDAILNEREVRTGKLLHLLTFLCTK